MHGSQIVGLDSVKNHVRQLHASAIIDRQRRAAGLGEEEGILPAPLASFS